MTLSTKRRRNQARCRGARVWLDGVEVTRRCFYVDGRRGVVRLYSVDERGKYYLVPKDWREFGTLPVVATEERRGHVRWGHS